MFSPVSVRAASAYRQVDVEASIDRADPHQLINLLFDALMQSLAAARGALARGDIQEKGRHIVKAVRLLEEGLKGGLNRDQGGELAGNLLALYDYCINRLTLANLRNDESLILEVTQLIEPVAQGWRQIGGNEAGASATKNNAATNQVAGA